MQLRKVLVTGSAGQLGSALVGELATHFDCVGMSSAELDICDEPA